jgi:hypothetical protein
LPAQWICKVWQCSCGGVLVLTKFLGAQVAVNAHQSWKVE